MNAPLRVRVTNTPNVAVYPPGATFGPRDPGDWEFVWLLEGRATYRFQNSKEKGKIELGVGQLLLIFEKEACERRTAVAFSLAQDALRRILNDDFHVRAQLPLVFGESSKPKPDLAVVVGTSRDYLDLHPSTPVLVVETSDTTLVPDQTTKSSLYARAGIEEPWNVDSVDRTLEVRRQPFEQSDALFGWTYRSTQTLLPGESVAPLRAPGTSVNAGELLP